MDIFSLFAMLGGLAFFFFGMTTMSQSLEKMAGSKLEVILKRMTSNRFKSLLLGVGITMAIQSSSAVTVMLVGLVNSSVMTLGQSIGVIMGTNIGTTITAWILSLTGIESDNLFMQLLKPKNFSPVVAFIGVMMIMLSKNQRRRDVGRTMVGFSILMYGMQLMEGALKPLAQSDTFSDMMLAFSNPLLGVLAGALITALLQSSSASVGILQALALSGIVSGGAALPIILGQNIGTCITAVLSSIGVNAGARRVAVVHVSFNLIGTAVFMGLFYGYNYFVPMDFLTQPINVTGIAICHTSFNVFTTFLLLPFTGQLEKLAQKVIPNNSSKNDVAFLDTRLINTPGVAVTECVSVANQMAVITQTSVRTALAQIWEFSDAKASSLTEHEDKLDTYEDRLGSYLVEIARHNISTQDSRTVTRLLHSIGDFERLGDHAMNILQTAQELRDKELVFSDGAEDDLQVLFSALDEVLSVTFDGFETLSSEKALLVEPLEETIDQLIAQIRLRHIQRLQDGRCTIQLGLVLSDLLTDCERIGDHCSNIALRILESITSESEYLFHSQDMHQSNEFIEAYQANMQKYTLSNNS